MGRSRRNLLVSSRRIVPDTNRRDTLVAIGAGVAVFGFIVYAFVALSRQSAGGGVEGIITAKDFAPQQETQITVGRGGVSSRRSAGEYSFQVHVPAEKDRVYKVTVDPVVYKSHAVGDRYYFVHGPLGGRGSVLSIDSKMVHRL